MSEPSDGRGRGRGGGRRTVSGPASSSQWDVSFLEEDETKSCCGITKIGVSNSLTRSSVRQALRCLLWQ